MRVGIIRCQQTEDMCPGNTCLKMAQVGKHAFEEIGKAEVVGFVSCGGCSGKGAAARTKMMVERGAEAIVLASCIGRGTPNFEQIRGVVAAKAGPEIRLVDWTH